METYIKKILFSEQTILRRLDELGWQITKDYDGKDLTVIAIMNGSIMFMSDLIKRIQIPLQIDCWSVSSYHGCKSTGQINFRQHEVVDVTNRHVLLLDDILDSGLTLHTVKNKILNETKALSVKSCVLLSKKVERTKQIEADYIAFDIDNEFVIGYGLDYNEHYRNLPHVAVLDEKIIGDLSNH
jgi:hypoxanthine phosphoribosyltransferase